MADAEARKSFINGLDWLHCFFCFEAISVNVSFYLFECKAIGCELCSKRMFARNSKKLNCRHCDKTVNIVRIDEQMPPKIRSSFEAPEKHLFTFLNAVQFQQSHRDEIHQRLIDDCDQIRESDHAVRAQTKKMKNATEKYKIESQKIMDQLKGVMPKERIEELLTMSPEDLDQMTYADMVNGSPRPRRRRSGNFFETRSPVHPMGSYQTRSDSPKSSSRTSSIHSDVISDPWVAEEFCRQRSTDKRSHRLSCEYEQITHNLRENCQISQRRNSFKPDPRTQVSRTSAQRRPVEVVSRRGSREIEQQRYQNAYLRESAENVIRTEKVVKMPFRR